MTTVEVLRKAKAELERRGWYQGGMRPIGSDMDTCPVCAAGAINLAATGTIYSYEDENALGAALVLLSAVGAQPVNVDWEDDVGGWNDETAVTKEEVLNAFDRAIALAEASETPKEGTP